jgi:hypothetical protein
LGPASCAACHTLLVKAVLLLVLLLLLLLLLLLAHRTAVEAGVQSESVTFAAWEDSGRGIASKLMAHMGFKRGAGLGRQGVLALVRQGLAKMQHARCWLVSTYVASKVCQQGEDVRLFVPMSADGHLLCWEECTEQ